MFLVASVTNRMHKQFSSEKLRLATMYSLEQGQTVHRSIAIYCYKKRGVDLFLVASVTNRMQKQFSSEKLRLYTMYNLSNKDKLSIGHRSIAMNSCEKRGLDLSRPW